MKKNICFFVGNLYKCGGIQKVVSIIANKLIQDENYNITIVSLFKTEECTFFHLDERIEVTYVLDKEENIYKKYFKILKEVSKKIKALQVDIFISSPSVLTIFTLPIIRKDRNIKFITWEHGSYDSATKNSITYFSRIVALKLSDYFIVLTKNDLNIYKNKYKTKCKIIQIYNPIEVKEIQHKYNIESKKIITVGRIEYSKGFDILLNIGETILKKYTDWEWHIYGNGKKLEYIKKYINENNINNLKIMGECKNIEEKYKEYSLYVCTSRYEGFGLTLTEAKQQKLPLISFKCAGPAEIIQDNKDGYLIDCYDSEQMAFAIERLITNKELRFNMSQQSNSNIEQFKLNNIIDKWKLIINE